jgi:hypothetical protein
VRFRRDFVICAHDDAPARCAQPRVRGRVDAGGPDRLGRQGGGRRERSHARNAASRLPWLIPADGLPLRRRVGLL